MPIYRINNDYVAITKAGVGGPIAARQMEGIKAQGCNNFLVIGSAGVLNKEIQKGKLMIPVTAVRDEGTSYHYVEPSREIHMAGGTVNIIEEHLKSKNIPYIKGKTWTTDCFYRETAAKIDLRKKEDCISVEMECASYMAVSQYLGIKFGQILYAGDNLDSDEWDSRDFLNADDVRHQLVLEAIEIIQKF
jgi:uridine phosphorylase